MKTGKLLSLTLIGLIACCLNTAVAQGIAVVSSNGTTTNIPFSEIRSLVFDNHNMHVNRTVCQDNYFSMTFTNQVIFADNLSVSELSSDKDFSVFPNPATTQVSVRIPDNQSHLMELFTLQGTLIQSVTASDQYSFDVSGLSAGVYFIHMDGASAKFIKQ